MKVQTPHPPARSAMKGGFVLRPTKRFLGLLLAACLVWAGYGALHAAPVAIDPAKGVSFEQYLLSGNEKQKDALLERIRTTRPSAAFVSEIQTIRTPLLVAAVSSISCPDCGALAPFLLALDKANIRITVRFFARNTSARELVSERTGLDRVPTLLFADAAGNLCEGAFIEHPKRVRALIQSAESEEDAKKIISDFRAGKYNEEIEKDLVALLKRAEEQARHNAPE